MWRDVYPGANKVKWLTLMHSDDESATHWWSQFHLVHNTRHFSFDIGVHVARYGHEIVNCDYIPLSRLDSTDLGINGGSHDSMISRICSDHFMQATRRKIQAMKEEAEPSRIEMLWDRVRLMNRRD